MASGQINAFLVNAFTKNGAGGNPAGVVLNADDLDTVQKQMIAKQLNFSETAFVSKKYDCNASNAIDFDVSFYTPTQEVDFCGHATLAAFTCLLDQGVITHGKYVQMTKVGALDVAVKQDGRVIIEQAVAQFFQRFEWQDIEALIYPSPFNALQNKLPIEVVSTGLKDCFIPVPKGMLDTLAFDFPLIARFCKRHDLIGFHLFELEECADNQMHSPVRAQCRNIAPLVGIDEESATGSSSGALACYLNRYLEHRPTDFEFEQGRKMGCLSSLTVKLTASQSLDEQVIKQVSVISNDELKYKVNVSGYSKLMGRQRINV